MKNILFFIILAFIFSCTSHKNSEIIQAHIGYNLKDSTYSVNTEDIIFNGIVFPNNNRQKDNSMITSIYFRFSLKPKTNERYYYKIFYQNESYKFPETDSLSYENFYGSWYDSTGFKEITSAEVIDSFIIAGNPRFEKRFFGAPLEKWYINDSSIFAIIHNIKNNPEWKKSVEEKAKHNSLTFDEQAYMDAIWVLKDQRNNGNVNHRWKRNPRMGYYSSLLVVCSETALKQIPSYIQYTYKTNEKGLFVNPYYYFLYGDGKNIEGVNVFLDTFLVKLTLHITPGNGVFVDKAKLPANTTVAEDNLCGTSYSLFRHALFEHFFSHENRHFKFHTIPVIVDWEKEPFTIDDYERYKKMYANISSRKSSWIRNTTCACANVTDKQTHIEIFNPPSETLEKAAKLNVGIKTRIGITYGKITAKVKFSPMLNKSNIWNGITHAIWLITQDLHDWNNRRYSPSGYTPKGNPKGERSHYTAYSEIDFEIVKASPYWPPHYYNNKVKERLSQNYKGQHDDTIIVALTNWDLASSDPPNFNYPLQYVKHQQKEYEALRWDELYQALTIRAPVSHKDVFLKDYYYFQIEWKPCEIIWRIGPEKNMLSEIGYMSYKNTSIPNNQMVLIVNQEYHLSEWWPVPVFEQDFIPFLKNKHVGKIYEITIE
ncbi:MAG: hypothetical protein N2449_01190 [Bacteroidales bacterium]|nr:hypothetical protein [Bacteroidales bacterium]